MANQTTSLSATAISAEFASASPSELEHLLARYLDDPRVQVQKACERARRRLSHERAERARVRAMYERMEDLGGQGVVLGVDEVGRGSLAGPLTVCAVMLPYDPIIWDLNDSKKLSPSKRTILAARVAEVACTIGICHISSSRIDSVGMTASLREAVLDAVEDSGVVPDCVLIDGNPLHAMPCEKCVVHGDALVANIAAASIVAKVTRDELMQELDRTYPGYHLASSKGYGSAEHIAAIREKGLSPIHRMSFCSNFLETPRLF